MFCIFLQPLMKFKNMLFFMRLNLLCQVFMSKNAHFVLALCKHIPRKYTYINVNMQIL